VILKLNKKVSQTDYVKSDITFSVYRGPLTMPNENCDCAKCSVSLLQQVQFGILLGYKPCCIDSYCDVFPLNDEEYWRNYWKRENAPQAVWKKPHLEWFHSVRRAGKRKFTFVSDWVMHHFEKAGMSKVWLCAECRETVVKHVYEHRDDWQGAKRKVIDFERRVFEEEYDPTLKELTNEAHKCWDIEEVKALVEPNPKDIFDILFEKMKC